MRVHALSVVLLVSGTAACADEPARFPPDLAIALQTEADEALVDVGSPGLTLTVVLPDGRGTSVAAGLASLDTGAPMAADGRFRIGSITKSFVAVSLLRLEARGVVDLSDPVADTLPELGLPATLTYEHLLGHTGGLFNFTDDFGFLALIESPFTPLEVVEWALDDTVSGHGYLFPPATDYSYSNTGFYVLGLALERLTGRPLHEVLRAEALAPAGLERAGLDGAELVPGDYVDGHLAYDQVVTTRITPGWTWAAGGMVADGADVCRWARALWAGDLLPADDRVRVVEPSAPSIARGAPYGFATQHATRGGRAVVGHTGSTMGFKGEVFVDPADGTCVAVLTNDFFSVPSTLTHRAFAAVDAH